ncbi:MAG: amidophosphoribosyltransferase, partial [Firmicutes bacterium]|nr:amidophosphoribosyltransferase [Bacillota bacterium]
RYSYGEDGLCPENTQPLLFRYRFGELAIAHNGNLLNHRQLRNGLESQGAIFQTTTDSELLAHFVAREGSPEIEESLKRVVPALRGGYAFVILTRDKVIGLRDPLGIRPLSIGLLNGKDYVLASETCAFDTIGAEFVREVEPGEMVTITDKWISSHKISTSSQSALCIFEFIYFARPDSDICGKNVHLVRRELGRILAREHPVDADIVIGVPDSSISAASGYAEKLGLPFEMGLIKNRYIGRNFLQPSPEMRKLKVGIKLNPVRSIVEGKKVAIIDDSIVRGTTSLQLIKMVRQAGAREVHMRISSPPVISPCYYGINIPIPGELIASRGEKEILRLIKADSLGFLSIEEMIAAVGIPRDKLCLACFTGDYPLD